MLFWLAKKLLRRRKGKAARAAVPAPAVAPPFAPRLTRPEWKRELTDSMVRNCEAPPEEVILHAHDLYCDEVYGPILEGRREMADLHAELSADIEALEASAFDVMERARARHPFEFARIIEHKE